LQCHGGGATGKGAVVVSLELIVRHVISLPFSMGHPSVLQSLASRCHTNRLCAPVRVKSRLVQTHTRYSRPAHGSDDVREPLYTRPAGLATPRQVFVSIANSSVCLDVRISSLYNISTSLSSVKRMRRKFSLLRA
jgi:hypothetical protein